ncbi:MAG: hypothetical protein PSN44_03705 [Gammaproteobacteria bacterium]|nr:hypothetical protein [Gammaproteobacteria bacterium]
MLRVIIFCDICNPQGVRYIEQNRSTQRGDVEGRRITDGRSWFEGSLESALDHGWVYESSEHICPRCQERHNKS